MSGYININGKNIAACKAVVPADSAAFQYGDGLFETLRSYKGNIFKFDAHLERLYFSLKELKYNPDFFNKDFIKSETEKLLKINKLSDTDAYIKIIIARRHYSGKFRFDFQSKPDLIIITKKT